MKMRSESAGSGIARRADLARIHRTSSADGLGDPFEGFGRHGATRMPGLGQGTAKGGSMTLGETPWTARARFPHRQRPVRPKGRRRDAAQQARHRRLGEMALAAGQPLIVLFGDRGDDRRPRAHRDLGATDRIYRPDSPIERGAWLLATDDTPPGRRGRHSEASARREALRVTLAAILSFCS